MARSLFVRGLSLLVAVAAVRGPAAAETIRFEFSGLVSELSGGTGVLGLPGAVQLGDPFTGRFAYEVGPANPDQLPTDATEGRCNLIDFQIDQSFSPVAPFGVRVIHHPGIPTLPPLPPNPGMDSVTVIGSFVDIVGVPRSVSLRLEANFGAALGDDSLPLNLALSDFPVVQQVRSIVLTGLQGNPTLQDAGRLTSLTLVPEPATLSLLCLVGPILLRKRRRSRINL